MQAMEEMIARPGDCAAAAACIVRGKRTKRQRLQAAAAGTPGGTEAAISSTSSAQFSGSTTATEEEDMANCLILLARGCAAGSTVVKPEVEVNTAVKLTSRRFAEAATSTNGRAGFYVYECKTCSKCFPSFQALGGHRASHKKPKASIPPPPSPMAEEAKAAAIYEDCVRLSMNSGCAAGVPAASASGRGTGKQRIHECSICGAEFISGQALGGHMRRHRPASHQESLPPPPAPPLEAKKGRSGLSLDLNLPAPSEDDDRFSFASKTPLLLSTSSLIDCHY